MKNKILHIHKAVKIFIVESIFAKYKINQSTYLNNLFLYSHLTVELAFDAQAFLFVPLWKNI